MKNYKPRNFVGAYITGLSDNNVTDMAKSMAQSEMTDYIFWSIHVDICGNLYYNDVPIAVNGTVILKNAECLKALVSVGYICGNLKRIWLSIGSGGVSDFWNINEILNSNGLGRNNLLSNFKAIADYLDVYGFDYDNEDQIENVNVIVKLTKALYGQNSKYRFSFCPFDSESYWVNCLHVIYKTLGTQPVEGFNLQCYSGGGGNNPPNWVSLLEKAGKETTGISDANLFVRPILAVAAKDTSIYQSYKPAKMTEYLQKWKSQGAAIWNTGIVFNSKEEYTISDYAKAIYKGILTNEPMPD